MNFNDTIFMFQNNNYILSPRIENDNKNDQVKKKHRHQDSKSKNSYVLSSSYNPYP